jgi:hypothetical protein
MPLLCDSSQAAGGMRGGQAVGDIVVGSVLGPSSQRANECRIAMFLAGFPEVVPVCTVNRCGVRCSLPTPHGVYITMFEWQNNNRSCLMTQHTDDRMQLTYACTKYYSTLRYCSDGLWHKM